MAFALFPPPLSRSLSLSPPSYLSLSPSLSSLFSPPFSLSLSPLSSLISHFVHTNLKLFKDVRFALCVSRASPTYSVSASNDGNSSTLYTTQIRNSTSYVIRHQYHQNYLLCETSSLRTFKEQFHSCMRLYKMRVFTTVQCTEHSSSYYSTTVQCTEHSSSYYSMSDLIMLSFPPSYVFPTTFPSLLRASYSLSSMSGTWREGGGWGECEFMQSERKSPSFF